MKATMKQQLPKLNSALKALDMMVGEWEIEVSFPFGQPAIIHGRASFNWLEGGAFLVMHSDIERTYFPSVITVIGRDDSAETYCMLYFDSRGVSRTYEMSISNGVWEMWRQSPGFSQRFTGTFDSDGNTITGRWKKSTDGSNWEHDFDLIYRRVK